MTQTKKVTNHFTKKLDKKPEKKRVSAKQKALASRKTPTTLKTRRLKSKTEKKQLILTQRKKAHLFKKLHYLKKDLITPTKWTEQDIINEIALINQGCKLGNLTIAWGIDKIRQEVIYRNTKYSNVSSKDILLPTPKKVIKTVEKKPYKPSRKAHQHHLDVLKAKEENILKNINSLKKNKRKSNPNRLVCIQKGTSIARLPIKTAILLVEKENWKFIPKESWKKVRADKSSPITLLWTVGKVRIQSPQNPDKIFARMTKKQRIDSNKKYEMENKRIKARRHRKGIPSVKRYFEQVQEDFTVKISDTKAKKYYKFSKEGLQKAKKKYKTLHGIINAVKTKKIDNCIIGNFLTTTKTLNSKDLAKVIPIIKHIKTAKRNTPYAKHEGYKHINLQRIKNKFNS